MCDENIEDWYIAWREKNINSAVLLLHARGADIFFGSILSWRYSIDINIDCIWVTHLKLRVWGPLSVPGT